MHIPFALLFLQGGGLYDRLHEACRPGVAATDAGCLTVAQLKQVEGSKVPQPRLLVLCCPAGIGLDSLVQSLVDGHPNTLCRVVSHTSRDPLVRR